MVDAELHCNYRKCHKLLEYVGYITSCSHAFCKEHGGLIMKGDPNALKCPVCDTVMTSGQDIVRTNLNPTEKYKSMILAGLKPDDAIEIATRSIRFWSFQIAQEISRSKFTADHYRSQVEALKTQNSDAERAKKQSEAQVKQMTSTIQQLKIQLLEKNRHNQKLQADLDNEKRQKKSLLNQHQLQVYDSPHMNSRVQQYNMCQQPLNAFRAEMGEPHLYNMDRHNNQISQGFPRDSQMHQMYHEEDVDNNLLF